MSAMLRGGATAAGGAVCACTDIEPTGNEPIESSTAATMTVRLQRNPSNIACPIVAAGNLAIRSHRRILVFASHVLIGCAIVSRQDGTGLLGELK